MKKNLILLTGIVFLITVLLAGACNTSTKQQESSEEENGLTEAAKALIAADESTTVRIFLKDTLIDGSMHLQMYDSKQTKCGVIDNLVTVVFPGDIVIFDKAQKSKVNEVTDIRQVEQVFDFLSGSFRPDSGLYVLRIHPDTPMDTTIKYEIDFQIKKDTTYTIDPYLKIPKQL